MNNRLVVVYLVLMIFLIPTAYAASNQGFRWGVVENQILTYDVTMSSSVKNDTFQIQVQITDLSEIPENLLEVNDIMPLVSTTVSFANQSSGTPDLGFEEIEVGVLFVLPVGNWSVLQELFSTYFNIIDGGSQTPNPTYWGYNVTVDMMNPLGELNIESIYTKADGVLQHFEWIFVTSGDESYHVVIDRIAEFPIGIVIGVVIVGAIAVVAILIYIKMKR